MNCADCGTPTRSYSDTFKEWLCRDCYLRRVEAKNNPTPDSEAMRVAKHLEDDPGEDQDGIS